MGLVDFVRENNRVMRYLANKSVHCFSPLLVFLRQSFSLGNDPNGNVTLPVSNARARSEPAGRDFRFFAAAAPKVMVLAGQMFPPLFSLKITFSPIPRQSQ